MAKQTTTTNRSRKLSSVPPMPASSLSDEERSRMIAERAYFLAADRGFAPGAELDDWLTAEREIDERLTRS